MSMTHELQKTSNEEINATVFVQNLHEGVTTEQLFKEFSKFGKFKRLVLNNKKQQAKIVFEEASKAQEAIRSLNYTQILRKEIVLSRAYDKNELTEKKKFNLFLKNIPEDLQTKVLDNFLTSTFGEVSTLILKKNEEGKNLGYGYLQFEKKESYSKILDQQLQDGKLTIPNTAWSFNVEDFNQDMKNQKNSSIFIRGFYENAVEESETEQKKTKIDNVIEELKKRFADPATGCKLFVPFIKYHESKKNFWANIEIQADSELNEEKIFIATKAAITENFSYKNGQIPSVSLTTSSNNERNILVQGLKVNINEETILQWINEHLKISLQSDNVKVLPTKTLKDGVTQSRSATIFFDSKADGENMLIFCAKKGNADIVHQIFQEKHRITLNMTKAEVQQITSNMAALSSYYKKPLRANQQQTMVLNPQAFNLSPSFGGPNYNPFIFQQMIQPQPHQMRRGIPNNGNMPLVNNATPNPINTIIAHPNINVPQSASQQTQAPNVFDTYLALSEEQKKKETDHFAKFISSEQHKGQFEKLNDKSKLLGQIIYYKIQNITNINDSSLDFFKTRSAEQAQALLHNFQKEAGKITPMLIDTEVFEITDIIEIINSPSELLDRCVEAIELLDNQNETGAGATPL